MIQRAREAEAPLDLSVLVPTHGRAALLPRAVEAWRSRIPSDVGAEIVIVDDGSRDATPSVLRDLAAAGDAAVPLIVVRQPNLGLAAARNRGIAHARGRILLFSDDDMVPRSDDFVRRHLDAQASAPGAWVSRLVVPEEVVTTPFQAYWRRRLHAGTESLAEGKDLGKGGFWFATLSIPRERLGSDRFAEAFADYGWEEHELGLRLHRRGVRARFLRHAEIEHHDAVDFATARRKFRSMGRAAWTFARLQPSLEVAVWTGTHPLSRALRALARQEARAAALEDLPSAKLSDHQYRLCLEGAYARGLREGRRGRRRGSANAGAGGFAARQDAADEEAK